MPVTIKIIPEIPLIFSSYQGVVTLQEILERMHAIYDDANFAPGLYILADLSEAADLALQPEEIRTLADEIAWRHSEIGAERKLCLVRNSQNESKALASFIACIDALATDISVAIKPHPSEAARYLGLDQDKLHLLPARYSA